VRCYIPEVSPVTRGYYHLVYRVNKYRQGRRPAWTDDSLVEKHYVIGVGSPLTYNRRRLERLNYPLFPSNQFRPVRQYMLLPCVLVQNHSRNPRIRRSYGKQRNAIVSYQLSCAALAGILDLVSKF
jgi:hypothetical protein